MAAAKDFFDQMSAMFKAMSTVQKIIIAAVVVLVAVVLLAISLGGGEGAYKVLYSGLSQEDAAAVVNRLKEQRVPYALTNNGTAITVPAEQVFEVRLQLAGEGLPRGGGVGFEIFDKTSLGTTDFVQRLNYQRALQGELARTIMELQPVSFARVHIATPKESVFIEDQKEASASVVVKLHGRQKLSANQVKAIVNLVASAVPGLEVGNITVADTRGRLLFRQQAEQDALLSATQLEYQRRIEQDLRNKVQTMLEEVVGVGRTQARVTAEIDFDRRDVTEESFDPEGQVIRSEQLNTEEDVNNTSPEAGIPGVKGNLASFSETQQAAGPSGSSHKRNNITRNYEVSKTTRRIAQATGIIKRLSVAVMVDGTYKRQEDDNGNVTMEYQPRTADELSSFKKIIQKAIGYDEERGDQVEIVGVPFAQSAVVEPAPTMLEKWRGPIEKLAVPFMVLCSIVLVILFVIKPFFKLLAQRQAAAVAPAGTGGGETTPGAVGEHGPGEEEEDLTLAPRKMSDKERIKKLAQSDPSRAADLVRRWLREEM